MLDALAIVLTSREALSRTTVEESHNLAHNLAVLVITWEGATMAEAQGGRVTRSVPRTHSFPRGCCFEEIKCQVLLYLIPLNVLVYFADGMLID